MIPFVKKQLAPNRLAVYFVALSALAAALVTVLGDLDFQSTAGILGSVALVAGVVAKWLGGWQQYEKALYQSELIRAEHVAHTEQQSAALAAAQAVGGPRRNATVTLPR